MRLVARNLPGVAWAITTVIATLAIYPAVCFGLARVMRKRVVREAEFLTKGV